MAKILLTALRGAVVTWAVTFGIFFALAEAMAVDHSVDTAYAAALIAFGFASLAGLGRFTKLIFRAYAYHAPAPPPPAAATLQGAFVADLAVAIGVGCFASVLVYLGLQLIAPQHAIARTIPGILGVLAFLAAFFRRLVAHMFPASAMPAARALRRRRSG